MTASRIEANDSLVDSPDSSDGSLAGTASDTPAAMDSFERLSLSNKAKLIYCKSHVAIHPTTLNKDNISGYMALVEVAGPAVTTDKEGNVKASAGKELLVTWVPDELLSRMDAEDREGYKRMDAHQEEDGFVFVSLPPPRGEKYAFSIPVSSLYSILVYPVGHETNIS